VLSIAGDHVPLMPLVDVAGSVNVPPSHIGSIGSNVGITLGLTVTVIVVGSAHSSPSGVNVYVVVVVLSIAGDHVPLMPLVDVAGSVNVPPSHIGSIGSNVGTILSLTVISIVVGTPQGSSGVNVYSVVPGFETSIADGDQVPDKPFSEVVGSDGGGTPVQNGPIGANVAIT
jgi:hypothetical protein